MVILFLTIPLWFAACWYECTFRSKNKTKRERLKWPILIFIIVLILLVAWAVYYFNNMYKYNDFYQGTGDKDDKYNYSKTPKTTFLIFMVFITILFVALFIYFIFVSESWAEIGDESEASYNQEGRGALDWGFRRGRGDDDDDPPNKNNKGKDKDTK